MASKKDRQDKAYNAISEIDLRFLDLISKGKTAAEAAEKVKYKHPVSGKMVSYKRKTVENRLNDVRSAVEAGNTFQLIRECTERGLFEKIKQA